MRTYALRDLMALCEYAHVAWCISGGHFLVAINDSQTCPLCADPYYCIQ